MASNISADELISEISCELAQGGWNGMAWACLRRSKTYQKAYQRFQDVRLSELALCRQFGLIAPKNFKEAYQEGRRIQFRVVRLVAGHSGTGEGKEAAAVRKVMVAEHQVMVILSMRHNIPKQLRLARVGIKALKKVTKLGAAKVAPQKLRSHAEMVAILAPRLAAYVLSNDLGWGPTQIGRYLFPRRTIAKAKTAARDLIESGSQYIEQGYLSFAMHAELEAAGALRGRKSKREKEKEKEKEEKEARAYSRLIISPLPALGS
jgi:hypothetical protein